MSLLSWLGLAPDPELTAAGLAADQQNAALSLDFWKRGLMTDEDLAVAYDHYQGSFDDFVTAGAAAVDNANNLPGLDPLNHYTFDQGVVTPSSQFATTQIDQSITDTANEVKGVLATAAAQPFKFIPWWIWILALLTAGGFAFVWLGGPAAVRGILKPRA